MRITYKKMRDLNGAFNKTTKKWQKIQNQQRKE